MAALAVSVFAMFSVTAACFGDDGSEAPVISEAGQAVAMPLLCDEMPEGMLTRGAALYQEGYGNIYVSPSHPRPGDELFVVVEYRTSPRVGAALARWSADGWQSEQDTELDFWCRGGLGTVHGASLGRFEDGDDLQMAVRVTEVYPAWSGDRWFNNDDHNYRASVRAPAPVSWVGDTHLRVGGRYLPAQFAVAGQSVEVATQVYPMGAADGVWLHYSTDGGHTVERVAMKHDADQVGAFGVNEQFAVALPGGLFTPGSKLRYWVEVVDSNGSSHWDSADGRNYHLAPQEYAIGWAGGLGSYRPTNRDYTVGGLFSDQGSTSTGCWNHGASFSSYVERAVRVHVPGLTDRRDYAGGVEGVGQLIRVEVVTDARPEGKTVIPATFRGQHGNDFLYSFRFVTFGPPGCIEGLEPGTYGFKVRFSVDGGRSFRLLGTELSDDGGEPLAVQYAARCSYFGDPDDCIPTESRTTRSLAWGEGVAVRLESSGEVVTATRTLTADGAAHLSEFEIVGEDADLFDIEFIDPDSGELLDAAEFKLEDEESLTVRVSYRRSRPGRPDLPHRAQIRWYEHALDSHPGSGYRVTGLFLRGRAR